MTTVGASTRLRDVVLTAGGIQTGPFGSQLHAGDYSSEGVGVIMPSDMIDGRVNHSSVARVSQATAKRLKRHKVSVGDILFSRRGEIGRFVVISEAEDGWLCGTGCLRVRLTQKVLPAYAAMAFESHETRKWLQRNAVGQTMPNLSASILANMPFATRSIDDQVRWAACHREVVELQRLVDRNIDARRRLRRGLLQDLLSGQKRLRQFRDLQLNWSSLARHVTPLARRNRGNLQLVLTASGEHGLVDQRAYFKRRVAGADLTKYCELRRGEFAYNRSAMIAYPFGATKRLDDHAAGALSTLYLCFAISDPDLDSDYLRYVFESGVLNRQLRRIARIGARAHGLLNVTDEDFFALSIPLPGLDEQRRIADVLTLVDREIGLLLAQRNRVTLLRSGLVNKLLTTEIVVPS